MTAQMNHVYIFCTAVGTLFTSLPPGLRMFSALKLPKEGSLPSFDGARMAHFGGLREQRTAWGHRSYRPDLRASGLITTVNERLGLLTI